MAEELLKLFDEGWAIREENYNHEVRYMMDYGQVVSLPSPLSRKTPAFQPPPLDMRRILDRTKSIIITSQQKPTSNKLFNNLQEKKTNSLNNRTNS